MITISELKKLVKFAFRRQIETGVRYPIEVRSMPGMGKSEAINQVAAELSAEWEQEVGIHTVFLSQIEPYDVGGIMMPVEVDGTLHTKRSVSPLLGKLADYPYGLLFLDEFAQANPDVQKTTGELLLKGLAGDTQLPITTLVIAASNRLHDRSGVTKTLAFIENRRMLVELRPDVDGWIDWALQNGVTPAAVTFAKQHPGIVFPDSVPDKPGPFCTPRSLTQLDRMLVEMPEALQPAVINGYLGEGAGAQFSAHMRMFGELADFEDVVEAPMKAKLPDRPDATYAMMQLVAFKVTQDTADPVFDYLMRMPKEFQISGIRTCLMRCRQIVGTPKFSKWVMENRDLILKAVP